MAGCRARNKPLFYENRQTCLFLTIIEDLAMPKSIHNAVALVTGANRERGIGRAIVRVLLERGAARVYAAGRSLDAFAALQAEYGARVVPLLLDIENPEHIRAAVERAGDIDILVNNAGLVAHAAAPFDDPAWLVAGRREMEVNVFGTLAVTQAFAPVLARNGGGTVVNVVSVVAMSSFSMLMTYSASKAALHSLTQSMRQALKGQSTHVIGVYPGPIDTEMGDGFDMLKAQPIEVGQATVAAIESGQEDVYPDPMARQLGSLYDTGPKAAERAVAAM
jgi:NAD(P)-dependent dehydrogenase (short-subunit alcohol dehydrogenase family)